ncbi:RDD family protein [Aurantimicrobium minutum]|uniref:RDD family protein n=1 Tax=Aurantimicrobium minutum TaxID=708131 RepID=UPI002475CDF1|nr:RDD family protein [Aurantimicrobium minutum]
MASNSSGTGKRPDLPLSKYPGERLGLPEKGPQSVARVGRRFAAITVDWVISALVLILISGRSYFEISSSAIGQLQLLGVFVALQILGIWAIGGSIGHRLLRLYMVNVHGGRLDFWRPIVRSVLLALVIPALVWDSDQRGFHDKIAGTLLLRSS